MLWRFGGKSERKGERALASQRGALFASSRVSASLGGQEPISVPSQCKVAVEASSLAGTSGGS